MDIFRLYLEFEDPKFRSSVVHQLVDEMQKTLGVSLEIFKLFAHPRFIALGNHLLQRIDDKGQWSSHLVRNVDEEPHFHLMQLFLVHLFLALQFLSVFLFLSAQQQAGCG